METFIYTKISSFKISSPRNICVMSSSNPDTNSESSFEMNDDDASTSSSSTSSTSEESPSLDEKLRSVQRESANKLTQLAQHATDLMDKYSDEKNQDMINDPSRVYDEIAAVTEHMTNVWKEYNEQVASIDDQRKEKEQEDESKFRAAYMDLVTEAFSDELDDLRKGRIRMSDNEKKKKEKVPDILKQDNIVMPGEGEVETNDNVDVDILIEMLESEGWSKEEKKLLLEDLEGADHMDTDTLTIHEKRRREIFGQRV